MARNVDLTGKLGLGEKPTITIGDTVLMVNDSARNMLQVMKMVKDGIGYDAVADAAALVFDPKSRKALDKLDLSMSDFTEVVSTAVDLIVGGDSGNAGTPATT